MDGTVTKRVREAFSRRVATYDTEASVQKQMVSRLCDLFPTRPLERILELGCGTGELTRALLRRFPTAHVVAIDVAQPMIQATQEKCADEQARLTLVVADAETYPWLQWPPFDLVCTSAMLQWCTYPQNVVQRCVEAVHPDGFVAFATFGEATLHQLRTAFVQAERRLMLRSVPRTLCFPTMAQVAHWMTLPDVAWTLTREEIQMTVPDAYALLQQLKRIGANVVRRTQTPPFHKQLFHEMAMCYEQQYPTAQGLPVTYDVLYGVMRRKGGGVDQ